VHPPTIVLFTNGPELFDAVYLRYLSRVLRDHFPFREVALKLVLRCRSGGGGTAELPEETLEMACDGANPTEWDLHSGPEEEPAPPAQRTHRSPSARPQTWDL